MHPIIAAIGLLTHLAHGAPTAQQASFSSQEGTVIQQRVLPVGDVVGGKLTVSKSDRDAVKEQRRHNKAMEREISKLHKNDPFAFGAKAKRQPKGMRTLPANSNAY